MDRSNTTSSPRKIANPPAPQSCPRCSGDNLFTQQRDRHVGLYCAPCGRWIKWLPQNRPIEVMPFGKHKNTPIGDLPDDYLNWVLQNLELKESLYKALSNEFERRGRSAA